MAVIALELDLSASPQMRRRLEKHWDAAFRLRRALQRDAEHLCTAYLNQKSGTRHRRHAAEAAAARKPATAAGPQPAPSPEAAIRSSLRLTRKGLETRAREHASRSGWLRAHITRATGQHLADEVWVTCDRFLFPDKSGRRAGPPNTGSWWDFRRIPGRARSHTKDNGTWETYRLAGTLQGHLDDYAAVPGTTVAEAAAPRPGTGVLAQPRTLPAPQSRARTWRGYDGPLTVVYTGLPGGDLVMPVRLPQGAGQFPRLAAFLADPARWHKIDLVRARDRKAPGGWRYYAHLTVLGPGWASPATQAIRDVAPAGRLAGCDGNVSNIAIASIPAPAADSSEPDRLLLSHLAVTPAQRDAVKDERAAARRRQRYLDRSRRAANQDQYRPSRKQHERDTRRAQAGLPARALGVPGGSRHANKAGIPVQAYRKDHLTAGYQRARADHAAAASATARRKDASARQAARLIVAIHGPNFITEDVSISTWARRWGAGIATFTPGRLLAALAAECRAAGGSMTRASTRTTALSQHCTCGTRARKDLSQRTHQCACGIEGDRDLVSAALATAVTLTDPGDPATAQIDLELLARLHATVLAGHVTSIPLTGEPRAQQEGPARSTIHHSPPAGAGEDGSHDPVAPAGQGERPVQPRNRTHGYTWGRRRNRRTRNTPGDSQTPITNQLLGTEAVVRGEHDGQATVVAAVEHLVHRVGDRHPGVRVGHHHGPAPAGPADLRVEDPVAHAVAHGRAGDLVDTAVLLLAGQGAALRREQPHPADRAAAGEHRLDGGDRAGVAVPAARRDLRPPPCRGVGHGEPYPGRGAVLPGSCPGCHGGR